MKTLVILAAFVGIACAQGGLFSFFGGGNRRPPPPQQQRRPPPQQFK